MVTQKPISTISYNSEAFLREKLDTWVHCHIIQAYQYICHKGEDGDKDHIHLRIEPNKRLDAMTLSEELREFVIGCEKPLCCRPFRPSKEEDWILYAVHDKEYLSRKYSGGDKGEKLPYEWQDIKCSEYYDMEVAFVRAKSTLEHTSSSLAKRILSGESAKNLIMEGENVYLVNSLIRAIGSSDYERVASKLDETLRYVHQLKNAIEDYGLIILTDEDGNLKLEVGENPFNE